MADTRSSGTDDTARLEAALNRIAKARAPVATPGIDTSAIAGRLDALIAEIRAVLGKDPVD
jgi:hypothetical protein